MNDRTGPQTVCREGQYGAAGHSPFPPEAVVESSLLTVAANQQLVDILAHGFYPVVQQFLNYQEAGSGTWLWREGDSRQVLALVLSGRVETLKETEFPNHPFVTGIFGVGSIVGEDGFFNSLPCSSSVRVLQNSGLLILTREQYDQLEKQHPAVANLILKWMMNSISGRLHNAQQRLATIF